MQKWYKDFFLGGTIEEFTSLENDPSLRTLKQAKNGHKIWLLNFSSGIILLAMRSIETLERAHKHLIDRKIQNRKVDNDFI